MEKKWQREGKIENQISHFRTYLVKRHGWERLVKKELWRNMGFGFKSIHRTRTFIFIQKSITSASWMASLPLKLKLNQRNYPEFPALPAVDLYLQRQAWLALESLHLCSSDSLAGGFLSVSNDTDVHPSLDEPACALNQRVCLNHLGNLHDSLRCQAHDRSQEVLICVWEVPGHSPARVIIQCCCLIPKETYSGNITMQMSKMTDLQFRLAYRLSPCSTR